MLKTCPKDHHGFYNFSLAAFWHRAIVERTRIVIVEESAGLPRPRQVIENAVHESEDRLHDRGQRWPRPALPEPASHRRRLRRRAAGSPPRSRGRQLPCWSHRSDADRGLLAGAREPQGARLGVHSEMLTNGHVDLTRSPPTRTWCRPLSGRREIAGSSEPPVAVQPYLEIRLNI